MGKKFKGRYRIESSRKPNWDYSSDAIYFVTICTGGRQPYFGNVLNKKMILSDIGQIAFKFWREIPEHFKFVRLDEFQIMPDHIHGLIEINHDLLKEKIHSDQKNVDRNHTETPRSGVSDVTVNKDDTTRSDVSDMTVNKDETTGPVVTTHSKQNGNRKRTYAASKKWKPGTLGTIINQYKRAVTISARKIDSEFYWQSRYHDSIVKGQKSLNNVRNYIRNNPLKWVKEE